MSATRGKQDPPDTFLLWFATRANRISGQDSANGKATATDNFLAREYARAAATATVRARARCFALLKGGPGNTPDHERTCRREFPGVA